MSIITDESTPILLGGAVVVIILIAFFSKSGDEAGSSKKKKAVVATKSAAPAATTVSTASKKKKKKATAASSKSKAAPVVVEEKAPQAAAVAEVEAETNTATDKKKAKKSKKKQATSASSSSAKQSTTEAAPSKPATVISDNATDDESDDEDIDLWQKERERALKKQEEKERAAAAATAAAEKARKEQEELEKADAASKKKVVKVVEPDVKSNGDATTTAATNNNGENVDSSTGEKKKRKRKKKKPVADDETQVKKAPVSTPAVEQWETVPVVEEWQEVGHKKGGNKAKAQVSPSSEAVMLAEELVGEGGESGETSVTMDAGSDPLIFIGKGGSTIQNLQATSGAKFDLDRTTNVLTISGSEDAVQIGLAEARSILATEADRKANETTETVTWGSDAIKAVIGRGGSNIRATQDATGCRIDADVDAGTLAIVGPREQVIACLTMCHNAAFGEAQDVIELGSRNAVNVVYGPNFSTIKSLQSETGCKVDITRGSTALKLSGSNEAVATATARIRALLEANRGFEMTIDNAKVGAVYGKGGETLRSIQDRTNSQIDVVRGATHAVVSVMATKENAEKARRLIQRAVDGEVELGPGEVAEEIELGSATAAVIGRGGSNVADLEKRHGVKINVKSDAQVARIVGKPEKVSAASKDILAIAKPIIDAEKAQAKAEEALQTGESAWQVEAVVDDDEADGW
eukprot:g1080.t1 g1080   contig10:1346160-1348415(-)